MKRILSFMVAAILLAAFAGQSFGDLISEFEPNPAGPDPAATPIELSGTPGDPFSGFLTFIETDGNPGPINSSDAVSGTYDANGLAVITLAFDVENPSYTLVFSSAQPTSDVDTNDDGILDDVTVFGTVFDAIGIIDSTGDSTAFATGLGGSEFSTAVEFPVAFRDASTGQWFGNNFGSIVDIAGNTFLPTDFDLDPTVTTFGSVNPTLASIIPEPSSIALLGLFGLAGVARRRK